MSEWIKCDEEMPDESGHYLIAYGDKAREAYWSPREYEHEKPHWVISNYHGEYELDPAEVDYWMHLPETPTE